MKFSVFFFLVAMISVASCKEEVFPKPKAMLRLDFPKTTYERLSTAKYSFDKNNFGRVKSQNKNSVTIDYPRIKGSIYLTYKDVGDNLNKLLIDSQKLSYEHAGKADNIIEQPFINPEKKVYGMFYEVTGNAASQAQFYVTDSISHFVTGSLYFYAKPNYDSIYPAANYLEKDIRRIMESMEWN